MSGCSLIAGFNSTKNRTCKEKTSQSSIQCVMTMTMYYPPFSPVDITCFSQLLLLQFCILDSFFSSSLSSSGSRVPSHCPPHHLPQTDTYPRFPMYLYKVITLRYQYPFIIIFLSIFNGRSPSVTISDKRLSRHMY